MCDICFLSSACNAIRDKRVLDPPFRSRTDQREHFVRHKERSAWTDRSSSSHIESYLCRQKRERNKRSIGWWARWRSHNKKKYNARNREKMKKEEEERSRFSSIRQAAAARKRKGEKRTGKQERTFFLLAWEQDLQWHLVKKQVRMTAVMNNKCSVEDNGP